jgi:hypothetical protein
MCQEEKKDFILVFATRLCSEKCHTGKTLMTTFYSSIQLGSISFVTSKAVIVEII